MNSTVDGQGRRERLPWVAFAVVAVISVGLVFAYYFAQDVERQRREEAAATAQASRGTSCEALEDARRAYRMQDRQTLREALQAAEERAIDALDSDTAAFGKAERMALYLAAEDASELRREGSRATKWFEVAREHCQKIQAGA